MLSALPVLVTVRDSDSPSWSVPKEAEKVAEMVGEDNVLLQDQARVDRNEQAGSWDVSLGQFRAYVERSLQTVGVKRKLEDADYQYLASRAGFVIADSGGSTNVSPTPAEYQEFKAWFARHLVLLKHCRKRFECMEPLTVCGFWVTREVAEQELQPKPEGTFLLRFGSSAGALVVSVRGSDIVRHYELRTSDIQCSGLEAIVARVQEAKQLLDLRTGKRWPRSKVLDRSYFKSVEEAAARKRLRQERIASEDDILGDILDALEVSREPSTAHASEASASFPSVNNQGPPVVNPLQPGPAPPFLQYFEQALGSTQVATVPEAGGLGVNRTMFRDYKGVDQQRGARGLQPPQLQFAVPLATSWQPPPHTINLATGPAVMASPFQPNVQNAALQGAEGGKMDQSPSGPARFQACLEFLLPPQGGSATAAQMPQQQQIQSIAEQRQRLDNLGFQHIPSVPAVHTPQLQGSQHFTEFSQLHPVRSAPNQSQSSQQQLAEQMDLLQTQLLTLRAQGRGAELQVRLAALQQLQQQQQQQQQQLPPWPQAGPTSRRGTSADFGSGGKAGLTTHSSSSLGNIMRLSGGPSLSSLMRLASARQTAQPLGAKKTSD